MTRIFASPGKYVQGQGIFDSAYTYLRAYGKKGLLLTDEMVWQISGKQLVAQLNEQDFSVTTELLAGEVTATVIQQLTEQAAENELIIALGGGKVIDVGKAIANQVKRPIAILPTSAATDAPASAISVLYSENGLFQEYQHYPKHPELILIDTAVIAKAPVRFLIAGMADALSTNIEAQAVWRSGGSNLLGGKPGLTAMAIAEKCEETIFRYGIQAVSANRQQRVTQALEDVVEANTLLSGLGFESGGLAAAHALHNGLSAVSGDVHHLMHGEKVAFTSLVQLALENADSDRMNRYICFYKQLGLPTTLADMNLADVSEEVLLDAAEQAIIPTETMKEMPFHVFPQDIVAAMRYVDDYVANDYWSR